MKRPRLRTVSKSLPPFPLNQFPKDFALVLGREIVYLLATRENPVLEGSEWESVFATCIGAEWKPSNVGLDDVVLGNTAWGAKSIKYKNPSRAKRIRLISGRNSPVYSFGESVDVNRDPDDVGESVLGIWNERVSSIREKFKNLRTVVLIKSHDLTELVVFEFETIRYDPELFAWEWNKRGNLTGFEKATQKHFFTWQPHGSQFTIHQEVPDDCMVVRIKSPDLLEKDKVLNTLGFDESWISVSRGS